MNKDNEANDKNGQIQEEPVKARNFFISFLLIGAVLIMAAILVNTFITAKAPVVQSGASERESFGFAPAASCCARNQDQLAAESIGQEALVYYKTTFGETADASTVEDYGCHQEVVVYNQGKPVRRLSYNNGVFSDLGPVSDETGS